MRGHMFHIRFAKQSLAIWLATAALAFAAPDQALAAAKTALDIQSYELRVDLDLTHARDEISDNRLHGTAQITLRNQSGAPIDTVPEVLNRLLQLKTATDADRHSLAIDQRLTELKDWETFQVRAATIHLKTALAPNQTAKLTLIYEGELAGYQETGMDYVRERLDPAFTILRPENFSYPNLAEPTKDAVFARWGNDADVFNQHLIATVPKGERVIYSGTLVAERKGEKTTTFDYVSRQPSGFFVATVGPYAELDRGSSRVIFFEQDRKNAERLGDALVRGTDVLRSWLGPMPSQGIEIVEIPDSYGSQTISPMIIQTADAFRDEGELNQLYHELSHVWDVKDTDPASCRYNEGLAMFMSALVEEKADNKATAPADMAKRLFKSAQRMLEQDATARSLPIAAYGQQGKTDFSYTVGGVFFALLHHAVGQEKFLEFIHTYRQTHPKGASFVMFVSAVRALGPVPNRLANEFLVGTAGIDKLRATHSFEELQAQFLN